MTPTTDDHEDLERLDDEEAPSSGGSGAPATITQLYLLRHADAGDSEAWSGPDEERPLTRKGRQQATGMGAFLNGIGFRPSAIVTSPKVRAAETAEIVGRRLRRKPVVDERLGEGVGLGVLEQVLVHASGRRPMLVGHDPDFSALITLLCGAARVPMKKGALARIDTARPVRPGSGTLRWLLPPSLFPPSAAKSRSRR